MAKKKHQVQSKRRVRRMPVSAMAPFLTRVPRDLLDWINDTAAAANLSRDAFMRQLLNGIREGFRLAEVEGSEESNLFRKVESSMVAATERAVKEAVAAAMDAQMTHNTGREIGRVLKESKR